MKKQEPLRIPGVTCLGCFFKPTTYNKGHKHEWMSGRGYTTIEAGHNHKINLKKLLAIASGKDNHTHRLLKKRK